jgi:glutathione peroxidase
LGGTLGKKIKWNFTKFLIGKDGQPIKRFAPTKKPKDIEEYIKKALGN